MRKMSEIEIERAGVTQIALWRREGKRQKESARRRQAYGEARKKKRGERARRQAGQCR